MKQHLSQLFFPRRKKRHYMGPVFLSEAVQKGILSIVIEMIVMVYLNLKISTQSFMDHFNFYQGNFNGHEEAPNVYIINRDIRRGYKNLNKQNKTAVRFQKVNFTIVLSETFFGQLHGHFNLLVLISFNVWWATCLKTQISLLPLVMIIWWNDSDWSLVSFRRPCFFLV